MKYEIGPIRPPSEAQSLLIRVTRGCHWNKCKFCGLYKNTFRKILKGLGKFIRTEGLPPAFCRIQMRLYYLQISCYQL